MDQALFENIQRLGHKEMWENSLLVAKDSVSGLIRTENGKRLHGIRRVYMTGCGTSLYAGQVGKYAIEHFAHVPAEAIPANTFARYGCELLGPDSLLIGISATGSSETVEQALLKAKAAGAMTLSLTANADSRLARAADAALLSGPYDDRTVVKSKSYVYSLLALYTLAITWGRLNGALVEKEADTFAEKIRLAGGKAELLLSSTAAQIDRLAKRYAGVEAMFLVAAGPNLGTMEEAALKLVEMSRIHAECQELEDFMHGRFRAADTGTPFFILAPQGRSDERVLDFLCTTRHIGCPSIVLTERMTPALQELATECLIIPEGLGEELSPLMYIIPFYQLGYRMGAYKGHDPASRRYEDIIPQETFYRNHFPHE